VWITLVSIARHASAKLSATAKNAEVAQRSRKEAGLNGGAASFAERKHGKVVANTMAAMFYVPIRHRERNLSERKKLRRTSVFAWRVRHDLTPNPLDVLFQRRLQFGGKKWEFLRVILSRDQRLTQLTSPVFLAVC